MRTSNVLVLSVRWVVGSWPHRFYVDVVKRREKKNSFVQFERSESFETTFQKKIWSTYSWHVNYSRANVFNQTISLLFMDSTHLFFFFLLRLLFLFLFQRGESKITFHRNQTEKSQIIFQYQMIMLNHLMSIWINWFAFQIKSIIHE